MAMWEFITASQNLPFTVSIFLMLGILVLEVVGVILAGIDFGALIDGALPDWVGNIGIDTDLDILSGTDGADDLPFMARFLHWLNIGKVPSVVLMIVFLVSFGLAGWGMQHTLASVLGGFMLPASIAWIPVSFVATFVMKALGGYLGKFLKSEETSAVSEDTFIGKVATISYGTARHDLPARGSLKDKHGHSHNVQIIPDKKDETFPEGTEVLLVRMEGGSFRAIRYVGMES